MKVNMLSTPPKSRLFSNPNLLFQPQYVFGAVQIFLTTVVQNGFSAKLGHTNFDFFLMLVVDLLHEFELGVWKSILTHLLRMLDSLKGTVLAELDCR